MFVVIYFAFLIGMCALAVLATTLILRMQLNAEAKPLVAMPAWVSMPSAKQNNVSHYWGNPVIRNAFCVTSDANGVRFVSSLSIFKNRLSLDER